VIDKPYTLGYQGDKVVFIEEQVEEPKPKKTRKKKSEVE
jgi:hypothetical protein